MALKYVPLVVDLRCKHTTFPLWEPLVVRFFLPSRDMVFLPLPLVSDYYSRHEDPSHRRQENNNEEETFDDYVGPRSGHAFSGNSQL